MRPNSFTRSGPPREPEGLLDRRIDGLRGVRRRLHRLAERCERLRESTSEAGFRPVARTLEAAAERACDLQGVVTEILTDVGGVLGALSSEPELDSTAGRADTPEGARSLVRDWVEQDRDALAELLGEDLRWAPPTRQALVAVDSALGEIASWF